MSVMTHAIALSGGKDSTALALRLAEVEPRPYAYLCTPTGNELPEMVAHWARLEELLGASILRLTEETLEECITRNGMIPNWRARFCTRELKIKPCLRWMRENPSAVLCVGLRADEPARPGIMGEGITCRFPLREWGWGIGEVWDYLRRREVKIPRRTDCALCFFQRIGEWRALLREHPEEWAKGEAVEARMGHTFRSPGKDRYPVAMRELRVFFEAEARNQPALLEMEETACQEYAPCRVCRI